MTCGNPVDSTHLKFKSTGYIFMHKVLSMYTFKQLSQQIQRNVKTTQYLYKAQ